MHESLKVSGTILIADHQSAKVEQPSKEALHFPASFIATQGPTVLGARVPVGSVGRDHFRPKLLHHLLIQTVAVVGFVPDQSFGHIGHHAFFQRGLDQLHFSRRSAFCPQGERKTMAVCNAHDLGALAALGFSNQEPPFLAGTKVPSIKHSLRSKPPASCRCAASVNKSFSRTPERTQSWKRRWAVWYEPYRGGRSFHGRPRPSSRTGSVGRMGSTIFHCWSVKSIHNNYTVLPHGTRVILSHFFPLSIIDVSSCHTLPIYEMASRCFDLST